MHHHAVLDVHLVQLVSVIAVEWVSTLLSLIQKAPDPARTITRPQIAGIHRPFPIPNCPFFFLFTLYTQIDPTCFLHRGCLGLVIVRLVT